MKYINMFMTISIIEIACSLEKKIINSMLYVVSMLSTCLYRRQRGLVIRALDL